MNVPLEFPDETTLQLDGFAKFQHRSTFTGPVAEAFHERVALPPEATWIESGWARQIPGAAATTNASAARVSLERKKSTRVIGQPPFLGVRQKAKFFVRSKKLFKIL